MLLRRPQVLLLVATVAAAMAALDECHTHPLCQVEADEVPAAPDPASTSAPLEDTEAAPEETQIEPTTHSTHFGDSLSVENQVSNN
jgi:hypothetical protein